MKNILLSSLILLLVGCQTTRYTEVETNTILNSTENRSLASDAEQSFDQLSKYNPYKYEVLFTDPECGVYKYKQDVYSRSGKKLTQKPQNVYCKNMYDLKRSGERSVSPQYRVVEWINAPTTKEVFLTYLSFSNKAVTNALCAAAQRGVKVKIVLSGTEEQKYVDSIIACSPQNVEKKVRGMEGGLGYAHNKFIIINPNTRGEFKLVFSSGNMTSGVVIHHENWNFITTHSDSYFAQSHLCAMNAEWSDVSGRSRAEYIKSIKECRSKIKTPQEKDIKVFFIPGEGEQEKGVTDNIKTAADYMLDGDGIYPGINNASKIWLACHRFFYNKMINGLSSRMKSPKSAQPEIKIVADDDTFYKADDENCIDCGGSLPVEYTHMKSLADRGAKLKFMETNGAERQLHHSKYLIFGDKNNQFTALFTGSANLTGAGFKTNWENSYYITIPEVVQKFADHYQYMWDKLATSLEDLPQKPNVNDLLEDRPIIQQ